MPARKLTRQDLRDAAEKFKNWGKCGPNDEIGSLNYTSPEDIVAASRLEGLAFEPVGGVKETGAKPDRAELNDWIPAFAGMTGRPFRRKPESRYACT